MAELISGKTLAAKLKAEAAAEAAELREKGVHARLAVVIVGENPASRTYVAGKAKDCAECGLLSDVIALPEETTEAALLEKILKNTQIQVRGPAGSGVPETFFQNIDLKVHKIKIQEFPLAYGGEPVKAGIVPVKGEP